MKITSILIVINILLSSNINAKELAQKKSYILTSKILKNGLKKVEIDFNQDKIVDRIETYKNDKLISVESDSTYAGKNDEWITYSKYVSPKIPTKIVKQTSKKNGKTDRIQEFYQDPQNDFLIITTKVYTNNNRNFSNRWTTVTKLTEQKEQVTCEDNLDTNGLEILKLVNEVTTIHKSLDQQYYITDMGHKIHPSCLERWGTDNFPALLNSTMSKGFLCLSKLADQNEKNSPELPNGAARNVVALNHILQTSGVTIICNESSYNWTKVSAHASTSPNDIVKESGIEHPFISINQSYPKLSLKPTPEENSKIMGTLFHEQLHNLGFLHGEDIEYAYTCETCCIDNNEDIKTQDACKICSGQYTGATDKNYITDLIAWGNSSDQSQKSAKSIIKFQKEFPQDRFGLFAYAAAAGSINSPVGFEMGKILKQTFSPLTSQEEKFIKESEKYSEKASFKKTSEYSKVVAESHIAFYYQQDANKALDLLETNLKEFKNILALIKIAQHDDSYIYSNIKIKVHELLVDIWMQGYPANSDKPENRRAQTLLNNLGLLKVAI